MSDRQIKITRFFRSFLVTTYHYDEPLSQLVKQAVRKSPSGEKVISATISLKEY